MITTIKKDITTATRGIIAHGVNCQGVMGSGVAGAIRRKWPTVFTEYKAYWDTLASPIEALGMVQVVEVDEKLFVANCFSQLDFGNDGKRYASLAALTEALEGVFDYAHVYKLPIYLPKIGCGLGGLDWETEVEPLIMELHEDYSHLPEWECEVFICEI